MHALSRVVGPSERAAFRVDQVAVLTGAAVLGAATFLFAILLESVLEGGELTSWDQPMLDWLVAHRGGGLDVVMRLVTDLGGTPVLPIIGLLVAGVVARLAGSWRPLALMAVTMIGSVLLATAVKDLVGRARPPVATALAPASGFAFPSGHTTNTTAVIGACAVLLWAYRRTRVWTTLTAVTLIVLVGFSRLYLGVHWLTDVLAGYALGLGWLAVVVTAFYVLNLRTARPADPDSGTAPVADAADQPW